MTRSRARLRGSVTRRGQHRYLIRVHIGGGRYKSRTVDGRTKRELERNWRRFLNELDAGLGREHGRVYVRDFVGVWLDRVRRTREYGTYSRYAGLAKSHVTPVIGSVRLDRLSHSDVQRCIDLLVDAGKIATANTCRVMIHGMCKLGVRRGLLVSNPAVDIAIPRSRPREYKVLSPGQAQHLLDVCRTGPERLRRLYPILHLLLNSGLRRGEALGLKWSSVDLEDGTIEVREQLKRQQSGFGVGDTKTHRRRIVHLGGATTAMLAEHRLAQDALREELGSAYVDRGFVFTRLDSRARAHGAPIAPNTLRGWFLAALKAAGLEGYRIHDLRDTNATLSIEQGVDLVTVSRRLGHSSITMTADRYVHPRDATLREAAERLDELFSGKYEQSMNRKAARDAS